VNAVTVPFSISHREGIANQVLSCYCGLNSRYQVFPRIFKREKRLWTVIATVSALIMFKKIIVHSFLLQHAAGSCVLIS
jgi:hypothetical protein